VMRSMMVLAGVEINNTNIRIWIHDKDLESLEKVLWEGEGYTLIKHTSGHAKVRKFLEAVPRLMNDVKELHFAAVTGDVFRISGTEFRQKVYLSKDTNGLTAFHKAVGNGHKQMAEHLLEKTDRGCLNVVDRSGRSALFYAAATAVEDEQAMYGWLLQMGADKEHTDNAMKNAEHYMTNGSEIDVSFCNVVPDAPRVPILPKGHEDLASKRKLDSCSSFTALAATPDPADTAAAKAKKKAATPGSPFKKAGGGGKGVVVKTDKLLFTSAGKKLDRAEIGKWITNGDVAKLEYAFLMGKARLMVGKSTWNDAARQFIKTVPDLNAKVEALHAAAAEGDLAMVKEIIKANPKWVFARDFQGRCALHKAAKAGHLDVVRFFLTENGDTTKIGDNAMRTVLHYAARCESDEARTEITEEAVTAGADKFARDIVGNMADFYVDQEFPKVTLTDYFHHGGGGEFGEDEDDEDVEEKIDKAIDDHDLDRLVDYVLEGDTRERLKDKSSDDEEVKEFLENVDKFEGKIARIHRAVTMGSLEDLHQFLDRKKYALAKDRKTGVGILHKAVLYGHHDVIKYIAPNFPKTMALTDHNGRTALHYAAAINDSGDIYRMLEELGADVYKEDLNGNSPEYYLSNRDELQHAELLDFVKGMQLNSDTKLSDLRIHPEVFVNMDNYVYPSEEETVEVEDSSEDDNDDDKENDEEAATADDQGRSKEEDQPAKKKKTKTKKIRVRRKADEAIIKKLDVAYRRLAWARNPNRLLKRFLTKPVFEVLKYRLTKESSGTLLDVIRAGVEFLDTDAGILAPDPESYSTFKPLLHPVICTLHDANPDQKQPDENWDLSELDDDLFVGGSENDGGADDASKGAAIVKGAIDAKSVFVESVAMRISRSIKGYPFQSKMSEEQYAGMEKNLKAAFKKITSAPTLPGPPTNGTVKDVPGVSTVIGGTYYPLDKIPKTLERQLDKDGLLFDKNDPVLKAANMYGHWPTGRGIFLVGSTAHAVASNKTKKKDVNFIWVNEADHLKVIVGRKDSNLRAAFESAHQVLSQIDKVVAMSRDDETFGFLTASPGMVGTGLKASARMQLPFLGSEPVFREEICSQHNLICERLPHPQINCFFEVSNKRKFGLTEVQILRELYRGLREIIDIESRYRQP